MPGDAYRPRCAQHFVLPGRPKRANLPAGEELS